MSLLRESEGSTNIARPKPVRRISASAAQNSTQVRRGTKSSREFDPHAFLDTIGEGRKAMLFPRKQCIFAQGDRADAVFYLQAGKVKLTVVSKTGKNLNDDEQWFRSRNLERCVILHVEFASIRKSNAEQIRFGLLTSSHVWVNNKILDIEKSV